MLPELYSSNGLSAFVPGSHLPFRSLPATSQGLGHLDLAEEKARADICGRSGLTEALTPATPRGSVESIRNWAGHNELGDISSATHVGWAD